MSKNHVAAAGPNCGRTRLGLLWSFTSPHRGALLAGLLLGLLASTAGLATPMITKSVLDTLDGHASLRGPVAALAGLLALSATIRCVQMILLGTVGERIVLDARKSLVHRLVRASVPTLVSRPTGELVARVTSDSVLLREAASASVVALINGTVAMVGTLVLMGVLDPALLVTTVTAIALAAMPFMLLMPGIAAEEQTTQSHLARAGGILEGTLRAIRSVKASRAEDRQADRVIGAANEACHHAIRAVRRKAIAETIAWAGVDLAIIVVIAVGAWRVSAGAMTLSSLIAFLLYAFGLMDPVTELSVNVSTLQSGIAAAGRMLEVQALDTEADSTSRPLEGGMGRVDAPPLIEFRCVTADYGGHRDIVRGLDLVIPRTGQLAIVGPSGAGKTTVLSLVMRFLEPREGEVLLLGEPYSRYTHAEIRQRIALVEQEVPVIPGTIRDNLTLTYEDASESELQTALTKVQLVEDIAALEHGLDTDLTSSALSVGQRQRIALARAIIRPSEILLLDEATAHVDGLTEAAIQSCVRERARKQMVITVAHRLSTVIDADTIVVMDNGRIRSQGKHPDLLSTDDLYRDLVNSLRIAEK
ncbi:ABC transporter ATP-binding protein [Mycobacterium sp. 050134]|uniref:ABC transporter ATP-binding protein n=1 Tax=Mycobacterium sp. 050134 TaxID=3096111 RepID=UPI002ED81844